jgi:hypothetical protein
MHLKKSSLAAAAGGRDAMSASNVWGYCKDFFDLLFMATNPSNGLKRLSPPAEGNEAYNTNS